MPGRKGGVDPLMGLADLAAKLINNLYRLVWYYAAPWLHRLIHREYHVLWATASKRTGCTHAWP